jgi:hypothetical protein
MKLAVILLALLACSEKKKPPVEVGAPPITCNAVGDMVAKNWAERGKRAKSEFERDNAAKMGPIASKRLTDHCIADRWSTEGVTCVVAQLEQRGREELDAEGSDSAKPAGPDQIEKCLTAKQVANLMGTPPPSEAPKNPPPSTN